MAHPWITAGTKPHPEKANLLATTSKMRNSMRARGAGAMPPQELLQELGEVSLAGGHWAAACPGAVTDVAAAARALDPSDSRGAASLLFYRACLAWCSCIARCGACSSPAREAKQSLNQQAFFIRTSVQHCLQRGVLHRTLRHELGCLALCACSRRLTQTGCPSSAWSGSSGVGVASEPYSKSSCRRISTKDDGSSSGVQHSAF